MNLEPAPLQNLIIFFSSAIWLHWIAQTEWLFVLTGYTDYVYYKLTACISLFLTLSLQKQTRRYQKNTDVLIPRFSLQTIRTDTEMKRYTLVCTLLQVGNTGRKTVAAARLNAQLQQMQMQQWQTTEDDEIKTMTYGLLFAGIS